MRHVILSRSAAEAKNPVPDYGPFASLRVTVSIINSVTEHQRRCEAMNKIMPRVLSGCGLIGVMNEDRRRVNGEDAIKSITLMHERSNGLGGGFAAYGIYPEHRDEYALHVMYYSSASKDETDRYIDDHFVISDEEPIP